MKNRYPITRWLLAAAVPAVLLTACSKDNDTGDYPGTNESPGGDIRFEIGFAPQGGSAMNIQADDSDAPQTRVATDAAFKSTWDDGDAIGIFACKKGETLSEMPSDNTFNNVKLTYNKATNTWSGPACWPMDGRRLDFYAYYPYQGDGTLNPAAIAFSVKTDQRAAADYSASDLLTAKATNGSDGYGKGETVSLAFSHPLAMVQVTLDDSKGAIDPNEEVVVLLQGVKAKAALNLSAINGAAPGIEVTNTSTGNDAVTITMHRLEQPDDADYRTAYTFRAVVPVQKVTTTSGGSLFRITNNNLVLNSSQRSDFAMKAGQAELFTETLPSYMHTVDIKAGIFLMGSPEGEPNRYTDEQQHLVTLTQDFYMGKYQVTRTQYAAFLNAVGVTGVTADNWAKHNVLDYGEQYLFKVDDWGWTPRYNTETNQWEASGDQPMIRVTWFGAKAYADWIGGSLPTEAQWEYACRAGTTTVYSFGDSESLLGEYAWYLDNFEDFHRPRPVGNKKPNPWGLYDMHGNVYEWCSDWYNKDYYNASPETDPTGPVSGSERVLRGGNWGVSARSCRSASRYTYAPADSDYGMGFRVVVVH